MQPIDLQIDPDGGIPVYKQIAEAIKRSARAGAMRSGHRLPPTRDLARELGVNRNTVIAAYDALSQEGWAAGQTGRGTYLQIPETAPSGWFADFSRSARALDRGELRSIYSMIVAGEGVSFAGSYPAAEFLPVESFREAVDAVLREEGGRLLAYGPSAGDSSLRPILAERMNGPVRPEEILVTNGAQQGLDLVFRALVDPGDAVVIEEPTYTGALSVLRSIGARIISVPVGREGLDLQRFSDALERHRPRACYLQPSFHNPTSAVMSEAKRREVLALAARWRVPIVEDDWAHDLRLDGESLPTLHELDGGKHVIYLSTFSKNLMPGLRVGWVAAPLAVQRRLVELKRVQDYGTSAVLQAALARFLAEGGMERHLERVLPAYRERRDAMLGSIEKHFPEGSSWTRPEGGLFVWATLPTGTDSSALALAARDREVLFSHGGLFHVAGDGRNSMRLTYSAAEPAAIERGIATLGELIDERMALGRTTTMADVPIL